MTYVYNCDGFCGPDLDDRRQEGSPAFMGEISEHWFNTDERGDDLKTEGYTPGQTITLCPECLIHLLIDGAYL